MSRYAFHPDAFADLDEIWEYIAQDNVDAAEKVLGDIHSSTTACGHGVHHRNAPLLV
jgi:plasmid stabilization system protein ParE